jgi:2'-5' RNA ligase
MLHEVCNLAAGATAGIEPFEFDMKNVILVPPAGPLRMVWAGIDDPTGGLAELHEALDDALCGLGLRQEERSFRPHITLARIKAMKNPEQFRATAKRYADMEFGTQNVEEVVVYNSQLTPEAPIYTPIARARLGE